MRILVTGASGWIGSACTTQLILAGHHVLGLARTDEAAATISRLGAEVLRGTLEDVERLRQAATQADGVVHLGYNHDFSQMDAAARTDRAAIGAFAQALEGTGGPLLVASGTLGLASGWIATERDMPDPAVHPRLANTAYTLGLAERGIRAVVVRFARTVHGDGGDRGLVANLSRIAREKGISAYIGTGRNRWPAVHRQDAATLVKLAVERALPGSVLHAVAEEGIATVDIARAIGASHGLPVEAIPPDRAPAHFGWLSKFLAADSAASSALTRDALRWRPEHPGLLADIAAGHYPGD